MNELPHVTRVRHETRRRRLTVARTLKLAPAMVRVVLAGEELAGFTSLGFDDHVKLFFNEAASDRPSEPAMRDFTPRRYDAEAGELWLDFFLHQAGPAATWAAQAAPGQELSIGGPRGSAVISLAGLDAHVLVGDETALPAIGRRLEELPPGTPAIVVLDVDDDARGYPLASPTAFDIVRVAPGDTTDRAARVIAALREVRYPTGACFTWVAGESHVARGIRRYLMDERGIDKRWIKAAGYWQRGTEATHETITD